MPLTSGVEETYYKNFVLTESGLKEFHKIVGNAVQRFPAPAELVYTIVNSDYRYFQTRRFEDVTHDMDVQKKNIIQIIMEAQFVDQSARIENEAVNPPLENWNIRVVFNILQKDLWDTRPDKISLRVKSEDRKWTANYIDKLEDLIYAVPRGNRTPTIIFWLFTVPLFFMLRSYFMQINNPADWYSTLSGRILFFAYSGVSALMVLSGLFMDFFGYRPHVFRILFGPESSFVWGQGKADHEAREQARQIVMWVIGAAFVIFLFISISYSTK